MTMKHSPLPWRVRYDRNPEHLKVAYVVQEQLNYDLAICKLNSDDGQSIEANAELIVRAVNSHDALVEALTGVLLMLEMPPGPIAEAGIRREATAALLKARGEQ